MDAVLDLIVSRLPEVMNIKACTIRLIKSAKGKLELKAAFGLSRHYLERGPLDDELATYFILNGEPVVIPEATTDVHTLYHKEAANEGAATFWPCPFQFKVKSLACYDCSPLKFDFFSSADINFAMTVAEQGGVAIKNAMDYQKMQDLLNRCKTSKPRQS